VNQGKRESDVERILVALDASDHSMAALQAATELAARFRAELQGLFVEDINLVHLARSPFASEIGLFSAARRQLHVEEVERHFRSQSLYIRRVVVETARRARIPSSFRVVRGSIVKALLSAASEADVLLIGRSGRMPPSIRRLGSTTRAILSAAPGPIVVLHRGTALEQPVVAVYDGSARAVDALAMAASLVEDNALVVLLVAGREEDIEELRAAVETWREEQGILVQFTQLIEPSIDRLADKIQMEGYGTLVLPADSPLLQGQALVDLVERVDVPVVLAR